MVLTFPPALPPTRMGRPAGNRMKIVNYSQITEKNSENTVGKLDRSNFELLDGALSTAISFGYLTDALSMMAEWDVDTVEVVLDERDTSGLTEGEWSGSPLAFRNPETDEIVVIAYRTVPEDGPESVLSDND